MNDVDGRPSVAVVVPTYNRRSLLLETVTSITHLAPPAVQVLVVSDGSTDGSAEAVEARGLTCLRTDRAGAAGARNHGWRTSTADVIAFLDDDCVAEPGWLDALVAPFADPEIGVVQGRTVPAGAVGPHDRTIDVASEYGLYESCNIAYRREALEKVDGFDERFGTRFGGRPFGEDTDLAWRVRRAGWRTAFASEAVVRHHVFPGTFRDSAREEWRRGRFAYLVREIPELRALLPAGPYVLRRQSVMAQAALVGLVASLRRPTAAVLALPYAAWVLHRQPNPAAAARQAALDAVASAALLVGSLRHRAVLL